MNTLVPFKEICVRSKLFFQREKKTRENRDILFWSVKKVKLNKGKAKLSIQQSTVPHALSENGPQALNVGCAHSKQPTELCFTAGLKDSKVPVNSTDSRSSLHFVSSEGESDDDTHNNYIFYKRMPQGPVPGSNPGFGCVTAEARGVRPSGLRRQEETKSGKTSCKLS